MPRPNPFLRRASSPGDINASSNSDLLSVPTPPLPQQHNHHPAKLTQASLSDSALKVPTVVKPSTFRNTQSRMMSIRPSRFVKGSSPTSSTSSPMLLNDTPSNMLNNEISSFIRLFDTFTQKIYIEGYLMKHNTSPEDQINTTNGSTPTTTNKKLRTKIFAELSGSTLTLWDTELNGSMIMPTYHPIVDTTQVHSSSIMIENGKKKKHLFTVKSKKSVVVFETSDEQTMTKWVTAIRLSCFEKQKLHQLFTLRLLSNHHTKASTGGSNSGSSSSSSEQVNSTFLQVRIPGTSIWQKYWVVLVDKRKKEEQQKSKRFGKKNSVANIHEQQQRYILLYESKKSKSPVLTLSDLTHAYAVYPESPQLIEKGSMIKIECTLSKGKGASPLSESSSSSSINEDEGYCWFMADNSEQTIQWLLAVYDAFNLYGRPTELLGDPTNEKSLNFGEIVQDVAVAHPKLFLEIEDVVQTMDVSLIKRNEIDNIMNTAISKKQQATVTRRPTGTRANSLPLITVISATEGQKETTGVEKPESNENMDAPVEATVEETPAPFKFARHVADSSDESEDDEGEEEDEDEPDSDDEPIGIKNNGHKLSISTGSNGPTSPSSPDKATFADSLIPDFDFGNGFDVPKNVTAAAVSAAVNKSSSHASKTLPTRGQRKQTHTSSISMFDEEVSLHTRKASMPSTSKEAASGSLFGDFSLSTDFRKFMDSPLDQRKYSLPANAKLSSSSFDRSSPFPTESRSTTSSSIYHQRWDNTEWDDEYEEAEEEDDGNKSRHPYDDDSYDSDFDGPLIPSLGDNFAPQNSLLDTYLGEQLSAKEQIEYAKATGQPLIQVSTKKQGAPRGGLVGMISQREKDRKEGNGIRVAERVAQDRLEREKERRIFEQRQQQFLKHQVSCTHTFAFLFSDSYFFFHYR